MDVAASSVPKLEDGLELSFGVEIEACGSTIAAMMKSFYDSGMAIIERDKWRAEGALKQAHWLHPVTQDKTWHQKQDMSVDYPHMEVCSPPMFEHEMPALLDVIRAMKRAGMHCNSSCGLHVHIGTYPKTPTSRKPPNLLDIISDVALYNTVQTFIKNLHPRYKPLARREKGYCGLDFGIESFKYDKYLAVHMSEEHGTVEFRIFNGSLSARHICNAVRLSKWIVASSLEHRVPVKLVDLERSPSYEHLLGLKKKGKEVD